jgi:hypothetical protein
MHPRVMANYCKFHELTCFCRILRMWKSILQMSIFVLFLSTYWFSTCTHITVSHFHTMCTVQMYNSSAADKCVHCNLWSFQQQVGRSYCVQTLPWCVWPAVPITIGILWHAVLSLYLSLNAVVAQIKNCPFAVTITFELKNMTATSDITGTPVSRNITR